MKQRAPVGEWRRNLTTREGWGGEEGVGEEEGEFRGNG